MVILAIKKGKSHMNKEKSEKSKNRGPRGLLTGNNKAERNTSTMETKNRKQVGPDYGALPKDSVGDIKSIAHKFAQAYGLNYQDEEDLRQELFLHCYRVIGDYMPGSEATLRSYLYSCCVNRAKRFMTAMGRIKRADVVLALDAPVGADGDDETAMVDTIADGSEDGQFLIDRKYDVATVVGQLDEELRKACELFKLPGMSQRELAKRLKRNRKYIDKTLMPRLREKFGELYNK